MTIKTRKLFGLILAGGQSKRMGTDKAVLNYHGKTQVAHLEELLHGLVDEVYVSCRPDQKEAGHLLGYKLIEDAYDNLGPSGGILSAFKKDADASWLVLACDMPFIKKNTLEELILKRDPSKVASCFFNGEKKWPEPLCAIYEPSSVERLLHFIELGKPCPRKVLMNSEINLLEPLEQAALVNANTPEDFENFKGASCEN